MLGAILEDVTGAPYGRLVRHLVRERAGFERTYYLDSPAAARIANADDESFVHLGRRNLTGFRRSLEPGTYAAGGLLSTAGTVAGFIRSLFTGRLLDGQTVTQMRQFVDASAEDVPSQRSYGLGGRNPVIGGHRLVGHTGTIPGYSAIAMDHQVTEYPIAVRSNLSTIDQEHVLGERQCVILESDY